MKTDELTPGTPRFLAFASRKEASEALAEDVFETLTEALAASGRAALVVSGGTSPVEFFHALRVLPLPWERITVVPSDERVVPHSHPDRNEAMIRRELLQGPAAAATLRGLLPPSGAPDSLAEVAEALPAVLDAVVLGMGPDGHTASLFPDSPQLETALRSAEPLALLNVPRLGTQRVSLTPAAVLASRRIDLLFFGQEKRAVYEAAAAGGSAAELPVRCVLQQNAAPLRVYWAP
jgi:6-phosphogluconolactonase